MVKEAVFICIEGRYDVPTRYSQAARIGDEGIDFISLTCTRSNALFLPRPRQDIGIDGLLELLDQQGYATGALAFIQGKAGLSRISKSGRYQIKADKVHFETWSRYPIPVIGIVYNPRLQDARWVSISEHIQSHPNCIETGPYVIEAPANQPFSEQKFGELQAYIEAKHRPLGTYSPQELQTLARKYGIEDIFQDNGGKILQSLIILGLKQRWGLEGNDVIDDLGREYELKIINILKQGAVTTHHHLNLDILARYRTIEAWYFSLCEDVTLKESYRVETAALEPLFSQWEAKIQQTGAMLNNPKIPLKFVRKVGMLVYQSPPSQQKAQMLLDMMIAEKPEVS